MTPRPAVEAAQVLVVGAGPVGLLLAGDLGQYGVNVVLADRLAEPMTESRASQLGARTMELLGQRGLVEEFAALEHEPAGHFGGLSFDARAAGSRYAGNWKVPQFRTEAVLGDRALASGVDLRREHELHGLDITDDAVVAEFRTPAGPRTLRAAYLVGCDGADSSVRGLAGFELARGAAGRELLRADVAGIDVPGHRFTRFERGFAASARRADGVTRVMVHASGRPPVHRTGPPSFDEVAEAWETVTGENIADGTPLWLDAFDDAWAQATRYRRGRVLLAGDAAHVHMPIGGQALNLGLQDAANLGWKLAAQVHGWAPPALLDSYHDERHPVAGRVIDNVRAQALLQFGGAAADPVRQVLAELLDRPGPRATFAGMLSGLDVRYEVGGEGGESAAHLGTRLPDLELTADGTRTTVARLLREGRGVLLDLTGGGSRAAQLRAAADGWTGRVRVVGAHGAQAPADGAAFLLRPDGHVVWTDLAPVPLREALRRWFGEPVPLARRP
ncbi:FAD-dependent monooxygenase [Streptomyces sp. NBC_01232]|uniref:FAD-dependent monooxygenase n=1 Tax=unclassified Streptomyces TaxID=2593676 RepID=UPI002E0DA913|nr:FAD-dependent monooxygenase [Streptomyces sp. NBC_01232]